MSVRRFGREVKLADPQHRTPPTQFVIWKFGKVNTVKGVFLFDKKSAATVMSNWTSWNNRLTFDYEHKATKEDGRAGDGKSAGSCLLSLKQDGLYATDVRWTPQASSEIGAGEWLYFSPTFLSDEKSGRILDLINIALTNIPATKGMTPLVAASRSARNHPMNKKSKKTQLANGAPVKQPNPAVKNANVPTKKPNPAVKNDELAESTEGTDENTPPPSAAPDADMDADAATTAKMDKVKAAKKRLAEAKLEHTLAQKEHDTVCDELSNGDDDGDMDDDGDGEDPDDGIINDEDQDSSDPDEPANHLDQDSDDPDEPANHLDELDEEDELDEMAFPTPAPAKPKAAAPVGPKSAPPGASTKTTRLSASDRAILAVTGETDIRRATGKLYALGIAKGDIAKAQRSVQFSALAKQHAKPGSLTPRAEKLGRQIFAQLGEEEAIGYLTGLSVVAVTPVTKRVPNEGARSIDASRLTSEELKMCERMGNDPEKVLAQKKANAERLEKLKRGE